MPSGDSLSKALYSLSRRLLAAANDMFVMGGGEVTKLAARKVGTYLHVCI